MKTFDIKIMLEISDNWIEDGECETTIANKLEEYLSFQMNPYCTFGEYKIDRISVVEKPNKNIAN